MPSTRRRFLLGAAATLLAGLAGCNGEAYGTSTASDESNRFDAGPVPEHHTLRNAGNEPPVWFADSDAASTAERGTVSDRMRETRGFVADEATADRLRFADVDGADAVREFVAATDFENETVYVETESIPECRTLSLCGVSWTDSSIHTDYGLTYRDADVACEADARDGVSTLIRVPEALDPDAVNSYGSGLNSRGCRLRRPPGDDERTTEPPNFGPKTADDGRSTRTSTRASTRATPPRTSTRTTEADR
ncbi:hypothetical protein C474_12881 [Halogeometricum pallidum JCM 14848]|uniref:Lipoprotein n=1 Tax=Halogeometricum pallidum JCM 14848 TaxID=1227487 RepID=M0D329_HALPD|nr:hypothetical protein [Halogeometricum pallidum]ELZ29931.1 hypothetical protein C474_12881 [Halogeometricum pallidum JCM 14848]